MTLLNSKQNAVWNCLGWQCLNSFWGHLHKVLRILVNVYFVVVNIFVLSLTLFKILFYRAEPCTPVQRADAHIEVSDQTPSGCRGCWECVAGAGSLWLPLSPWSLSQPSPGSICHPQISQVWHCTSQRRIFLGLKLKLFYTNIT